MRKFLMVLALGAASTVASFASTTCGNVTNNALNAVSSCTWTTTDGAVLTFSNFTLLNNNGSGTISTTLSTWDLTFTDSGTGLRLGFNPNANPITASSASVGSGGVYQFLFMYTVQQTTPGNNGNGLISSIDAGLDSSSVVANGSVQFVKSFTNGGNISLLNSLGSSVLTGSSASGLPSGGPLTIIDSVNVNGGNNGASSATLNSFYNQINTTTGVPEPVTLSLVGAGLLGMGFLRRRKASK